MKNEIKKTAIKYFVAGILATTSFLYVKDKVMNFVYLRSSDVPILNLSKQDRKERKGELEDILGDYYNESHLREYSKFLAFPDSLEFARTLGKENFSNYYINEYISLLKTGKSVELVKELEGRFRTSLHKEYSLLLAQGLTPKLIGPMDRFDVRNVARNLKDNPLPKEFLKYFSFDGCENSIKAAAYNPIFGTDTEKMQDYLQDQLKEKKQMQRKNPSRTEDFSQIKTIENINTLYLIKGYIDYFQDPENIKDITRIIDDDLKDPFSEHGGRVIFDNGKYNFKAIDPVKKDTKDLHDNHSYQGPKWTKYLTCIGGFHLHAIKEDSSKYSGPSGDGGLLFGGDLASLEIETKRNAYWMNCIVTKLKGDKFNADIYFRDVNLRYILGSKIAYSKDKNIVLDLGVYDMIRE